LVGGWLGSGALSDHRSSGGRRVSGRGAAGSQRISYWIALHRWLVANCDITMGGGDVGDATTTSEAPAPRACFSHGSSRGPPARTPRSFRATAPATSTRKTWRSGARSRTDRPAIARAPRPTCRATAVKDRPWSLPPPLPNAPRISLRSLTFAAIGLRPRLRRAREIGRAGASRRSVARRRGRRTLRWRRG
jgi:hypothetical protein